MITLRLASDIKVDDEKETGLELNFEVSNGTMAGRDKVVLQFGLDVDHPGRSTDEVLTRLYNALHNADYINDMSEESSDHRTQQVVACFHALEKWHDMLHPGAFRLCQNEPCRELGADLFAVYMRQNPFGTKPEMELPEELFAPA